MAECSGRGTLDPWRDTCTCPLGFEGARCELPILSGCMLASGESIAIRSWLLHGLEGGAGSRRWGTPTREAPRALGPLPCTCVREALLAPFVLRRGELNNLKEDDIIRCVHLPPDVRLEQFLHDPSVPGVEWRALSLARTHAALKRGVEPLLDAPDQARAGGRVAAGESRPMLLGRRVSALPLLPMARCLGGCGGRGWCEPVGGSSIGGADAHGRCGCFVPGGLIAGVGGARCADADVWRSERQPDPAAWGGPRCPLDCNGRGQCDWQGFCHCRSGWWGLDCGLTFSRNITKARGRHALRNRPVVDVSVHTNQHDRSAPWGRHRRTDRRSPHLPSPGRVGTGAPGPGDGSRADAYASPRIYVVDLPPIFRFGSCFACHSSSNGAGVDEKTERALLLSPHREADPLRADYFYLPGPPLVVDGHRLLAKLWHVRSHWAYWNETASPRFKALRDSGGAADAAEYGVEASRSEWSPARTMMLLLTERAAGDSFRLSSNPDDREDWPALASAPHVRGIHALEPFCARIDAAAAAMAMSTRGWPSLRSVFGEEGGYAPPRVDTGAWADDAALLRSGVRCRLPAELAPSSTARRWFGLQYNGNRRDPVYFQVGKDIVMPQLMLAARGGGHADQPSCDTMQYTSPYSVTFSRRELHRNRSTLLWFGGHPGHGTRERIFRLFRDTPGFELIDTVHEARRADPTSMSLSSLFCWVPRGQGEGDPTRHMISIFHGCVPVFSLGTSTEDDALPWEELLPWHRFSLRVPTDRMEELPDLLRRHVGQRGKGGLTSMQEELACAWRWLYWSSLEGSCFGESTDTDALAAWMAVLRIRLGRSHIGGAGVGAGNRALVSTCDGGGLPPHLLDARGHLHAWLAPGALSLPSTQPADHSASGSPPRS